MSMNLISIEQEALHLPLERRARLVYRLLASLDDLPEPEVEELWVVEARRRADEIDQGLAKLVSPQEWAREFGLSGSELLGSLRGGCGARGVSRIL